MRVTLFAHNRGVSYAPATRIRKLCRPRLLEHTWRGTKPFAPTSGSLVGKFNNFFGSGQLPDNFALVTAFVYGRKSTFAADGNLVFCGITLALLIVKHMLA